MNLIYLLLKNSWSTATFAMFAAILSGASSAGLIALINLALKNINSTTSFLEWSFVCLCGFLLSTTTISQILVAHLAERIIFNLRFSLVKRILACPLQHLEVIGSSRLLTALTEYVDEVSTASTWVTGLCVNVALMAGCLIYLSWLSIPIFLLLLSFIVCGICSYQFLFIRGILNFKLARETKDKLFQHFRTITEGTKELKLHRQRRQVFLSEELASTARFFQHYRVQGMSFFALAGSWGMLLFFIPIGLLIFVSPKIINNIPIYLISSYTITIFFMITPLRGILNAIPELSRANIALKKLEFLELSLATKTTEAEIATFLNLESDWTSLKLEEVTYTYYREREDSCFILGPIDLTFHPGEIVFIAGGNGSGKSTLAKLITGLYIPETGVIKVNGKVITDRNREWYRQQFSVVFADFYLFERLIGLSSPNLEHQAQTYLAQLQLDQKVQINQGVLSTTALSQGQRKRLALLTAYLEDRTIYVFDEWASDQDPLFRELFYTQFLPELKERGKTVLAVTHDDRYFDLADRIVKLDYGKVVGSVAKS